ncbi:MAG: cation diffusion facilitator family transporter, partial [Pseudomonadota bacterium]
DEDHRFGHGKAEAIAALMQTMLIVMSAALIAWRAGNRFMDGGAVTAPATGIGVSLFAIFVTLLLVGYQRRVARATDSIAIETDRLHYQSDLALNVAVILALALTGFGLPGADALFGFGIALWLAWNGYRAGRRAVDMLMDREWPELRRQQLLNLVTMLPDVDGVHELRTRRAGDTDFIQFHIWVDPDMTVASAHDITDRVEAAVRAAYPGAELFIHIDPRGHIADHEIEEDLPCPPASAT